MIYELPAAKMLSALRKDNLLPAILFRTARKQCDADVEHLAKNKSAQLSIEEQHMLAAEILSVADKYGVERSVLLEYPHYIPLVSTGVGAHHAGQLLIWRLVLEELMSRGLLKMLIATGTVAAGVDFPARTVIITAHSKRGNNGFDVLTASEFQQMSGRAGRRGKDAVGICLVAPGQYADARLVYQIAQRPPEPLRSAYFAAPSTVLNLLKFRNVDDLKYTVSKSLAAFLDWKSAERLREALKSQDKLLLHNTENTESIKKAQKRLRRSHREADSIEQRQAAVLEQSLDGLNKLGYIEQGHLTEKGFWAANLCTSLVLQLAEAVADHLFDEMSDWELVGAVAAIAGDSHRDYLKIKRNPMKKEVFTKLEKIIERIKNSFQNPANSDLQVQPDAATTVITWLQADSWSEFASLLRLSSVAEGDVARLVTQTADHLNQLTRLSDSHPELAKLAAEARKKILKPPLSETIEVSALAV